VHGSAGECERSGHISSGYGNQICPRAANSIIDMQSSPRGSRRSLSILPVQLGVQEGDR
jgi:hypothetical protein